MTASVMRLRRDALSYLLGLGLLLAVALMVCGGLAAPAWGQGADQPAAGGAADGPTGGEVPGNVLGSEPDSDFWRAIRQGETGYVSIPNAAAGRLIQSEGDNWRAVRNGPVTVYGAWAMLGVVIVLALFFALRGRIRIDAGPSGTTIERFNMLERTAHWVTATSFVVLALTGLNILYGRHVLLPVLGPEIFSAITLAGKYAHNFLAFAFMVGVVMIFLLWVRHNIPSRTDLKWLAVGGGMFKKGVHPAAGKFNAGQKLIFWAVVIGGVSISLSGLALLFPFQFTLFGDTFSLLNVFGLGLPENLTPMQEMQLSQLWHGIVGLILIAIIIAHIYIGSLGMEGAFEAMGSGQVDLNWAKEHHALWVAEVRQFQAAGGRVARRRMARHRGLSAVITAGLLFAAVAVPTALAEVSAETAATQIGELYGVEVLKVQPGEIDGRKVWLLTVMQPAGRGNSSFQVHRLAVDRADGALVPSFRSHTEGHSPPPAGRGASQR